MRKVIVLLVISLLFLAPIESTSSKTESNHVIAGYGPVPGDLFAPYAIEIIKNQLMVLDQFGVSIFKLGNNSFVKRFSVDVIKPATINWLDVFKSTDIIDFTASLLQGKPRNPDILSGYNLHTSFDSDSKGLLYIGSDSGILVVDPGTEKAVRTIALEEGFFYSFQISKDVLYLLKTKIEKESSNNQHTLIKMDLTGRKLSEAILHKLEGSSLVYDEFAFLPDLNLVAVTGEQNYDETNFSIYFFDLNGILIPTLNQIEQIRYRGGPSGRCISFQEPNNLLIDGYETDQRTLIPYYYLTTFRYEKKFRQYLSCPGSKKKSWSKQ